MMRVSVLWFALVPMILGSLGCQNQTNNIGAPSGSAAVVEDELHVVGSFNHSKVRDILTSYPIESTLFVFDIDNTLLTTPSEQFLASDEWYGWQRALSDDAPEKVKCRLRMQGLAYYLSHMEATEAGTAARFVAEVQSAGFDAIALTARSPEFRFPTERELLANGIDFSKKMPDGHAGIPGYYVPEVTRRLVTPRNASYQNGIAMLAGQHKGDALIDLLSRLSLERYEQIVFFDDKNENVEAMLEAFGEDQRVAVVFHYTAVDTEISQERISRGLAGQSKLTDSYMHFQRRQGCQL